MNGKCERKFNCIAWNYVCIIFCYYVPWYGVYFTGTIEKAAEVQIIIPSIGQNNSHTFVVQTYDKNEVSD